MIMPNTGIPSISATSTSSSIVLSVDIISLTGEPSPTLPNETTLTLTNETNPTGNLPPNLLLPNDSKRSRDEFIEIDDETNIKKIRIENKNENEKNHEKNHENKKIDNEIEKNDFLPIGVISGLIPTLKIANNLFKVMKKEVENVQLLQLFPLYRVEIQNTGAGGSIGTLYINICIYMQFYIYLYMHTCFCIEE
jgi:hypothetical protein